MTNPKDTATVRQAGAREAQDSAVADVMAARDGYELVAPTDLEMHFLIGWITGSNPAAVTDALDALLDHRRRMAARP